jgi:hypothetical protein
MTRIWLLTFVLVAAAAPALHAAAPGPPSGVAAIVSGNTVSVTWQLPMTGSPPLGYLVEASLSPGGSTIAAFLVIEPTIVLSAVPDGVYYLRVRAGNAEGLSAASHEVVVSVPGGDACPSPPSPPGGLSASVVGSIVSLTWLPPAAGCAATGYVVHAGSAPGLSNLATFNVGTATTLSVSAPEGTYFVRVVATNPFGASVASDEVIVSVGDPVIDLTGVWSGESDYINAPFEFRITQRGLIVSGSYQDQKDFGGVAGQVTGDDILLDVNFGDTGIRFYGAMETADRIRGTIWVPVLGRTFTFVMTR